MKCFRIFHINRFKPCLETYAMTLLLMAILVAAQDAASETTQARFSSPDKAVRSLINALSINDQAALDRILGSGGGKIVSSGDPVADRQDAEKFVKAYNTKHSFTPNSDGSMTLVIGARDWPVPIPLVKAEKSHKWIFDTQAGEEEILNRRIGRNELTVIQVCQAIADAQREYAERDPDGDGIPEYAQKFISDPGKKNGLYWKTNEAGNSQSAGHSGR